MIVARYKRKLFSLLSLLRGAMFSKKKKHNTGWVFVVSSWSHHTTTQRRRQLSCPGPKKGRTTRARKHCPSVATKTRLKIIQNTMQNTHTHTHGVCVWVRGGDTVRKGFCFGTENSYPHSQLNLSRPPTWKLSLIRAIVFPFRLCSGSVFSRHSQRPPVKSAVARMPVLL